MKMHFCTQVNFSHGQQPYLIVNDWDIWCSREWYSCDATDVFSQLSPHFQTSISREGPQHCIDEIFLGGEGGVADDIRKLDEIQMSLFLKFGFSVYKTTLQWTRRAVNSCTCMYFSSWSMGIGKSGWLLL